jgi:hypothetical protein
MCLLWSTNWGFISQQTPLFVVTAVKTSNLTQRYNKLAVAEGSDRQFWSTVSFCWLPEFFWGDRVTVLLQVFLCWITESEYRCRFVLHRLVWKLLLQKHNRLDSGLLSTTKLICSGLRHHSPEQTEGDRRLSHCPVTVPYCTVHPYAGGANFICLFVLCSLDCSGGMADSMNQMDKNRGYILGRWKAFSIILSRLALDQQKRLVHWSRPAGRGSCPHPYVVPNTRMKGATHLRLHTPSSVGFQ